MRSRPTTSRRLACLAPLCLALVASASLVGCEPSPWTVAYTEEFTGSTLHQRWSRYTGAPSSDPYVNWTTARARPSGGALVLDAVPKPGQPGRWEAGGVSNWRNAQTYGRWTIRFRAPRSDILSFHFLLWPKTDHWPPEIDIAEVWDPERRQARGFAHWIDDTGARRRTDVQVDGDLTSWNTVTLTWTPGLVVWQLNGKEFGRVTGDAVPAEPMWLALQAETQACDRARAACATDSRTTQPRVEIDRVVVERYAA